MAERLDPDVRRARILDTAMAVIAEEGYRGLTLRSLARRCDMSAPGLMHYFPDMPAVLLAVLERRDQLDEQAVRETGLDGRPLLDKAVERMASNPQGAKLFAMLEAEALDPSHPAHQYFANHTQEFAHVMAPYFEGHVEDPMALARRVIAVLDGLQVHWLQDPEGFDLELQWKAIADAILPEWPDLT